MAGKESPLGWWPRGAAPSARRRPGYPLVGCTPAEPASVSPGNVRLSQEPAGSQGQRSQHVGSGQDGPTRSSEGFPFFGLDNGVHLSRLVQAATGITFHIEHIVPRFQGGET